MSPKISVILPIYNTCAFLEEAVNSVVCQTFDDWELIAINDASTDESLSILKSFERDDSRIKVIDFKKNKGLGRVRNAGVEEAKGDYLVFLDSDDFMTPDALGFLNNDILKKPKIEVFVWGFNTCTVKGETLKTHIPSKPDKNVGESPFQLSMLNRKGFKPFAWIYIFKRVFVKKYNIGFAENMFFEDIQFSTQALFYAKKVGVIEQACYNYRKHGASITGKSSKQKIDDKFTAFTQIKTFLEGQKVFQHYQSLYLARFLALCVHTSFNEYFVLPKTERDQELDDYMYRIRRSGLLRNENLMLLRTIGLSLPKNEKSARKAYLGAYHGLKGIREHYSRHRFFMRLIIKFYRYRKGIK
jgi:CRISPR system Cascade subunit CasB